MNRFKACVCVCVALTFQAWPLRSSPCAGRCVCGGSTSLWRLPGRWLPSAAGWCLYNTLLPPKHTHEDTQRGAFHNKSLYYTKIYAMFLIWLMTQGSGLRNFCCSLLHPLPYFPPSVWINTYSLPFVLFNLLYFPPAEFTALRRCISTRLLTSHPKPAALPPDGHFHTWLLLTLFFCHFPELNWVPQEINYTECRVMIWSLFFFFFFTTLISS